MSEHEAKTFEGNFEGEMSWDSLSHTAKDASLHLERFVSKDERSSNEFMGSLFFLLDAARKKRYMSGRWRNGRKMISSWSENVNSDQMWQMLMMHTQPILKVSEKMVSKVLEDDEELDIPQEEEEDMKVAEEEEKEENDFEEEEDGDDAMSVEEEKDERDEEHKGMDGKDLFFRMKDMEDFADEGENEWKKGKQNKDDDEEEEMLNAMMFGGSSKLDEDVHEMKYDDFFDPVEEVRETETEVSGFQKTVDNIRDTISRMEEAVLQESKSWQLTGEIAASSRPEDSLLSTALEFERGVRGQSSMGDSLSIENVVRQRIRDKMFDDVERRELEDLSISAASKVRELEFESKDRKSLAELYEDEYLEKKNSEKREVAETTSVVKVEPQHEEALMMFEKLCRKLDALSNMQFTPRSNVPDPVIRFVLFSPAMKKGASEQEIHSWFTDSHVHFYRSSDAPAITVEDIIPEGVSSASLVAPQELYKGKRRVSQSKGEMSHEERRRERRTTKRRISKQNRNAPSNLLDVLKKRKTKKQLKTQKTGSTAMFQKLRQLSEQQNE